LINKIEHLGIAVRSIQKSNELMEKLLGTSSYKEENVDDEFVATSFFKLGETKIELLEAIDNQGSIGKFIEKRGEGIHHIALDVTDIEAELSRLHSLGFEILNKVPKLGADGKKIAFLHPKSTNGILVELCEDIVPNQKENRNE
jgi:methylmalonyl-CoA/ethylmalonyl-CoA epimerase